MKYGIILLPINETTKHNIDKRNLKKIDNSLQKNKERVYKCAAHTEMFTPRRKKFLTMVHLRWQCIACVCVCVCVFIMQIAEQVRQEVFAHSKRCKIQTSAHQFFWNGRTKGLNIEAACCRQTTGKTKAARPKSYTKSKAKSRALPKFYNPQITPSTYNLDLADQVRRLRDSPKFGHTHAPKPPL